MRAFDGGLLLAVIIAFLFIFWANIQVEKEK